MSIEKNHYDIFFLYRKNSWNKIINKINQLWGTFLYHKNQLDCVLAFYGTQRPWTGELYLCLYFWPLQIMKGSIFKGLKLGLQFWPCGNFRVDSIFISNSVVILEIIWKAVESSLVFTHMPMIFLTFWRLTFSTQKLLSVKKDIVNQISFDSTRKFITIVDNFFYLVS